MNYLFDNDGSEALKRFSEGNTLLALDYDGTLAPIATSPHNATVGESTKRLLQQAGSLFPCAVITGRARRDALALLAGVALSEVIGNHGAELATDLDRCTGLVSKWRETLSLQLGDVPGLWIEDKRYSLSIHFRHCSDKDSARRAIAHATERLDGVRAVGGKELINLMPRDAPNKGAALLHTRTKLHCTRAIFVGDDLTDEDVFSLGDPDVLTIRVGHSTESSANYYIEQQTEIDRLLGALVAARTSHPAAGAAGL